MARGTKDLKMVLIFPSGLAVLFGGGLSSLHFAVWISVVLSNFGFLYIWYFLFILFSFDIRFSCWLEKFCLMSFLRGLGGMIGQAAPSMMNLAGQGLVALGKSIAANLTCNWFRDGNSLLRYEVGKDAYNTERHTLVYADSTMIFEAVKWFVEVQGAPYDALDDYPDGRRPTMIALVIYVQQYRAPEGNLSLDTYEESGSTSDQGSLMYTEKNDVVIGNFFRLWGFDSEFVMVGGFKNGANPGPIMLQPRDEIKLAAIATDNFTLPQQTQSNVKGYITGTFTYRLHKAV